MGDCLCLSTLKDNWGRVADQVCMKNGDVRNQYEMPINARSGLGGLYCSTGSRNMQTPPFAGRHMVYRKDAVVYVPMSADRTVSSGRFGLGAITYAMVDCVIFNNVHLPVMSPGVTFACPVGTWMTCKDAPAEGGLRDCICNYPVATSGENGSLTSVPSTQREKKSNSIVKLVSFPAGGPLKT